MKSTLDITIKKGGKWDSVKEEFDNGNKKVKLPFILKGAYVYYCKHQNPEKKMGAKTDGINDKEYAVQILISKAVSKQLKKFHKKLQPKEHDAESFEATFKVPPPYKDVNDEYLVIKITNNAGYKKDGEVHALAAPKVFNAFKESLADTAIGNGSVATISLHLTNYDHPEFGKGTSINFGTIKVTELIEYVASGEDADDDDDFDWEEDEDLQEAGSDDLDDDLSDDEPSPEKTADDEAKEQLEAQQAAQSDDDGEDDEIF